jgi:hypothetical protein
MTITECGSISCLSPSLGCVRILKRHAHESNRSMSSSCRIRQHTSACVSIRQHTSAYVSVRRHTSAYVIIRQHTSAYVSIRQHTSAYAHDTRTSLIQACPEAATDRRCQCLFLATRNTVPVSGDPQYSACFWPPAIQCMFLATRNTATKRGTCSR